MTSRIVHSYFFRFRLIRREIRHFVFRIGLYETDKACRSAIPLRVVEKTRTKPTSAPSTVYRTNMPRVADSMRYIRNLLQNKPLHSSHGRYAYLLIWCLSLRRSKTKNPRTLSRPNTDAPVRLGGNGLERNRRQLQLLRKDPCAKIQHFAQNTPIYSRNEPLSYRGHGGYTVYNT